MKLCFKLIGIWIFWHSQNIEVLLYLYNIAQDLNNYLNLSNVLGIESCIVLGIESCIYRQKGR